ncbi:MAG: transposase [Prevotella sp.]|nr:transposase [Prevotella sp.]
MLFNGIFARFLALASDFVDYNDAFNAGAATIYQREDEILNYFINRATNAATESLNSKIKNFRVQLHGVVDVDFFLYRLSMIFG